jgi:hypothetical protein
MLVVAEGGNELTAVQALRLGAHDYLPRHLLTPERLFESLHRCLVAIAPPGPCRSQWPAARPGARLHAAATAGRIQPRAGVSGQQSRLGRNVALEVERERDAQDGTSPLARDVRLCPS